MLGLFQMFNNFLYKILGPDKSTRLAYSVFGKIVFKFFINFSGNSIKPYVTKEGISLLFTPSEALAYGVPHLGTPNPYETALLHRILRKGDSFIDLGGYIDGWHTLVASKIIGPRGHAYIFEPNPSSFKRLKENIAYNNARNITAEQMAVSNKNGTMRFYNKQGSLIKNHLHKSYDYISVKTVRLDDFIQLKKIKSVRLIKIDVEGAETIILKSLRKYLSTSIPPPNLLIEVVDAFQKNARSSESELLELLKKYGYTPYIITSDSLIPYRWNIDKRVKDLYFSKEQGHPENK